MVENLSLPCDAAGKCPSCRWGNLVLDGPRFGCHDRAECLLCGWVSDRFRPGTHVAGVGDVATAAELAASRAARRG